MTTLPPASPPNWVPPDSAAPSAPVGAAPGWYADPWQPAGSQRWFDGIAWTGHVRGPSGYAAQIVPRGGPVDHDLHWVLPTGRTWQSIVAGYVALFGLLLWPLGPVALGLGIWAVSAAGDKNLGGRGRATFAIAAGFVETLALLWLLTSFR